MGQREKRKKRRPFEIVWDEATGEMRGRELPLTKDEKLETFDKLRLQALTVDIARRRWDTAKAEAKETKEAWERECQRLYDIARHDPQGELFPVTDEEIREANQRSLERPEPEAKKKAGPSIDRKSQSAGEKEETDDGRDGEAA